MRRTNYQRTIEREVGISGLGLFHGQAVEAVFRPAEPYTGARFVRTDLPGEPSVPVSPDTLTERYRTTAVSHNGAEVAFVEHALAALSALGIDNVEIRLSGDELPVLDGSAKPYCDLLLDAGVRELAEPGNHFVVREPFAITDGNASIVALPNEGGFAVSYTLDYEGQYVGTQSLTLALTQEEFIEQIAPARTFCLEPEIQHFLDIGLGKGATADNVVIVPIDGNIRTPLRFPDEPVRHKILDLIGDLYMANVSFHARIVAVKSGHASNAKFVRKTVDVIREHRLRGIALSEPLLDIRGIQKSLPHRYPFLLVDRVIAIEEDRRIVGLKNVTFNEPFFQGHWPDQPVMPGVLLIEALAQIAGVLLLRRIEYSGKLTLLVAMDHVKLRKAVVPGDQVRLEAEIERATGSRAKVNAKASVDGKPVASALLKFMLADTEPA